MKHQQFFTPEDAPSSGGGTPPSPNGSNAPTTLTYNYGGQEITVDLSNPEQLQLAKDRLSKGHNMEKIAEERNRLLKEKEQLQKTVDQWNSRLEAAKTDPQEFSALVRDIEEYVGRPLSRQEKTDLMNSDQDIDIDPVQRQLAQLKKEFDLYKEQQAKAIQERELQAQAKRLVARLDEMEKDTARYPGFDRQKVYEAAVAAGTTDFEMVYFYLNRDELLKAERQKIEKEYEELKTKRKAAVTESDASPAHFAEPPQKFNRLEDVGSALLEEVKKGNISLFS